MRWLMAVGATFALALLGSVLLALAPQPSIEATLPLEPADVRALRSVVRRQIGGDGELALDTGDANRMLRWALQQHNPLGPWRAQLRLDDDFAFVQLSRRLEIPLHPWLNIDLVLTFIDGQPRLQQAHIGHLPLPARWFDGWLRNYWQKLHQLSPPGWQHAETLHIAGSQVRMHYGLPVREAAILQRQPAALWFGAEVDRRLRHYQQLLNDRQRWPDPNVPLAEVLVALIGEAAEGKLEPAAEHTALLLALAQQESEPATATLLKLGRQPSDRWLQPRLHRRRDLAQHFVLAAALSLYAGDAVASQLGIMKELEDIHGAGLDAADLLANHAGIRFAQAATSAGGAAALQHRAAAGTIGDGDIMPSPRQLPQSLRKELERLAETEDEQAVQDYLERILAPITDSLPLLRGADAEEYRAAP